MAASPFPDGSSDFGSLLNGHFLFQLVYLGHAVSFAFLNSTPSWRKRATLLSKSSSLLQFVPVVCAP